MAEPRGGGPYDRPPGADRGCGRRAGCSGIRAAVGRGAGGWPRPGPDTCGGEASRNPYVDLLRVAAIGVVVFGHWLAISITYSGGRLDGRNVLGPLPWTQWLTLVFQVMPVFFVVGGFANAASWASNGERGERWGAWLYGRALRLLVPTTVYVVVAVAIVVACRVAGVPSAVLERAGWAVALHLWFLPVYLGLVGVTPALAGAHRRWGLRLPAVLIFGAVAANTTFLLFHAPLLAWSDHLLAWGAVYQLGFAWHDGTLTRTKLRPLALAAAGGTALVGLVWLGPFPVSMVGVPGAPIKNSSPPSVAFLAYAIGQVGLLLAAEPALTRWLRRPRLRRAVCRANRMVMTLYLWHMAPVILAAATLYPTGVLSPAPIGSPTWLKQRLIWVVALTILFIPVAVGLRSAECLMAAHRTADGGPLRLEACPLLAAGLGSAGFAVAGIAAHGFFPGGRLPAAVLAAYTAGVVLVIVAGAVRAHPGAQPPVTRTRGDAR
ncbi:MAG: acyltransferase family protein [Actinoallomurus sp.]